MNNQKTVVSRTVWFMSTGIRCVQAKFISLVDWNSAMDKMTSGKIVGEAADRANDQFTSADLLNRDRDD